MPHLRATFRDLNTERNANVLPSGTAEESLNVVIDGTTLRGREGFATFDSGPGHAILNMFVAKFANGETWVVCKCTDGKLYAKEFDPTPGSWSAIVDKWSGHHASDRGWFQMWADRMYFSDRNGVTKWHPDDGTWKAGILPPPTPAVEVATPGGKEGYYHVYCTRVNSKTKEESVLSLMSNGVTTMLSEGYGGIDITAGSWTSVTTGSANDEFDRIHVYCSLGNTEYIGLGDGLEQFSYRAYLEFVITKSGTWPGAPGLAKADFAQDRSSRCTNSGVPAPGSRTGFYNGQRAVYLDVYPGGVSWPGAAMFSLSGMPSMVPTLNIYSHSGTIDDMTLIRPRPWEGVVWCGFSGPITGCGAVGDKFLVFTRTETWWLLPSSDGRLHPVLADQAHGAMSDRAVVTTGAAVHALANNAWLRASRAGIENIARHRFTPTIEAIPAAYRTASVAGKYTHRDEVWMAIVPNEDETKANRILIWDEARNGMMGIFEPANIGSAGITAMCELSSASHAPQMLIALDSGAILNYPEADSYLDGTTAYPCRWRGHFGQERRHEDQHLQSIDVHMGTNVGAVTLKAVGLRTAGQGTEAKAKLIEAENAVDRSGMEFDPYCDGNLFQIEISSDIDASANWSVEDMILRLHGR